jgi:hypothetical protein
LSTAQDGAGVRDVALIHCLSCTGSIKPSLQFSCNCVVINASEGSLCIQIFKYKIIIFTVALNVNRLINFTLLRIWALLMKTFRDIPNYYHRIENSSWTWNKHTEMKLILINSCIIKSYCCVFSLENKEWFFVGNYVYIYVLFCKHFIVCNKYQYTCSTTMLIKNGVKRLCVSIL